MMVCPGPSDPASAPLSGKTVILPEWGVHTSRRCLRKGVMPRRNSRNRQCNRSHPPMPPSPEFLGCWDSRAMHHPNRLSCNIRRAALAPIVSAANRLSWQATTSRLIMTAAGCALSPGMRIMRCRLPIFAAESAARSLGLKMPLPTGFRALSQRLARQADRCRWGLACPTLLSSGASQKCSPWLTCPCRTLRFSHTFGRSGVRVPVRLPVGLDSPSLLSFVALTVSSKCRPSRLKRALPT